MLRVIVEHMVYPVTLDVIHQIFSRVGKVIKIVTFTKNNTFQVTISCCFFNPSISNDDAYCTTLGVSGPVSFWIFLLLIKTHIFLRNILTFAAKIKRPLIQFLIFIFGKLLYIQKPFSTASSQENDYRYPLESINSSLSKMFTLRGDV